MSAQRRYSHAVETVPGNCDACMHCLRTCPTAALRIRDSEPIILEDRCIDCGACLLACPRKAIGPVVDTFKETGPFKHKVVVPSPVVYAQFGLDVSLQEIHLGLKKLGFDYIYDVFGACLIEAMAVQEHLKRLDSSKHGRERKMPLISSMCPAVVRLVQVKYPTLVSHVLPFEPPRELSAREAKIKVAREHDADIRDVGAFYISPCPAKSISVLQPAEKERSFLDRSIALSDIYMPLRQAISEITPEEKAELTKEKFVFGSGWERTGLMSRSLNIKNWIAVSGMPHVVGILDDIEEGKLESVAFVEANACIEGCVGGSLCVENIYVARSKTLILETEHESIDRPDRGWVRQLYDSGYFFMERELKPRTVARPAGSIPDAILFMKERDELVGTLPGLDCCSCGFPSCEIFAEEVLRKTAGIDACPYYKEEA